MEHQRETEQAYQNRVNEFLVSIMFGWEIWVIVGGALGILALACFWPNLHQEERQQRVYVQQAVKDDQIWSLLAQGGGLEQECYWHYELAVPADRDSSWIVAYYRECLSTRKQYPVRKVETREVLEVLQTRGIVYKRVYVGELSSIEQSFREAHPGLEPDFDLQSRPKP